MIRDDFRVLVVDLTSGRGTVESLEGRNMHVGGSGLAAALFERHGQVDNPWSDPRQPIIFAIGPLTGYFPLMSKTVCAFKSPYHDQYAESHAGGRSALALRFADLDALVVIGRADRPVCLSIGSRHLEIKDVHYLWGKDVGTTGKLLRRMFKGSGHRSILRIGLAGERGSAMAGINVDTYRHFGRLGGGAAMGVKNLKGIVIQGDGAFELPEGKAYAKLFQKVHQQLTDTEMMVKYHNLGTAENVDVMNKLKALPIRNLQQTSDPEIDGITGEKFAERSLLRNTACAGCPVGCIHVGFVREKFMEPNQYFYRQVAYDYEPIFATGAMLGVTDPFAVLDIMDTVEQTGLDVMSAGVALAWATEALDRGIIKQEDSLVPLKFGDAKTYTGAVRHLAAGTNEFYRLLAQGTAKAAAHYGGGEFACVLGQEMAGYATGEVFFVSQALGFRHSHLDSGGYSYDQKVEAVDLDEAVEFLVKDERERVFLTSMVACLFARGVYKKELLAECLHSVGYDTLAETVPEVSKGLQARRWQIRLATGYDPAAIEIPGRFSNVSTWKGPINPETLDRLRRHYAQRIVELGRRGSD
ncbi:MAG: aldehyde ferredoxin oxidoreductase [Desulfobacterales bacterium]|nr:aldehyde ferredoxin oxidoreductase [Desulfobacterales bacterium]